MFETLFTDLLNPEHELLHAASLIDWDGLQETLDIYYSPLGRQGKAIRMMVGIHLLKHRYNCSDEQAIETLHENAYWQCFCGFNSFQRGQILDATTLVKFRNRIGTEGMEQIDLPQMARLYSEATGWETSVDDLKRIAMRQLNLEKALNLRFTNFDRRHDMPTPRDLLEPIPAGNLAGWRLDEKKYNEMLDEYYDLHGWNKQNSYPTRAILEELNLAYVADELETIGKLG